MSHKSSIARQRKIPKRLQSLVWSQNIRSLDAERDAALIIHRALAYGSISDLHWLFHRYPKARVRRIFLTKPEPIYTKAAFQFAVRELLRARPPRYVTPYLKTVS